MKNIFFGIVFVLLNFIHAPTFGQLIIIDEKVTEDNYYSILQTDWVQSYLVNGHFWKRIDRSPKFNISDSTFKKISAQLLKDLPNGFFDKYALVSTLEDKPENTIYVRRTYAEIRGNDIFPFAQIIVYFETGAQGVLLPQVASLELISKENIVIEDPKAILKKKRKFKNLSKLGSYYDRE